MSTIANRPDAVGTEAPIEAQPRLSSSTRSPSETPPVSGDPFLKRVLTDHRVRVATDVAGHVLALAVTSWVFLMLNRDYFYRPIGYDEEFFAWGGWSITKGLVPYRDFIEFKPPMVFFTHALAQALFGFKDGGYRKFFALFPLLSVLLLQLSLVARGIGRLLSMTIVVAIAALFLSGVFHDTALSDCESIGLTYYMLGLAFLLWEGRHQKWTTMLGGAFLCCSVLSKEPFGPAVVCTWLGLFWLRGKPQPSRESIRFFAQYSLVGVAGFVVILSAFMIPTGSMKAYLALVRSYSSIYRDPQKSYCVAMGYANAHTRDLPVVWDKIRGSFLNERVVGYLAPLIIPSVVFGFRRSKGLFAVMVAAALAALWAPTATNCPWVHYYTMSIAGVVFILVAGFDSMKSFSSAADRSIRLSATAVAFIFIVLHAFPSLAELNAHRERAPWVEPLPGVLAFIAKNTVPSDKILTTGPPILYAEANRVSALRESNIRDEILGSYEGSTDQEKLRPLYQELVRNRPKVVFFDPADDDHRTRHKQTLLMPYLAEFHYQKFNDYLYLRP